MHWFDINENAYEFLRSRKIQKNSKLFFSHILYRMPDKCGYISSTVIFLEIF